MDTNKKFNIKVIVGSTRQGRFGDKAAAWVADLAKTNENLDVEVLDLRDYAFPFFEGASPKTLGGMYADPVVSKWAAQIAEADGFIFTVAEYNAGYTAVLKNALDVIYPEWNGKPVAYVGYGAMGGTRAIGQLRQVASDFKLESVAEEVHIMAPWFLTDEAGGLKAGALDEYVEAGKALVASVATAAASIAGARGAKVAA